MSLYFIINNIRVHKLECLDGCVTRDDRMKNEYTLSNVGVASKMDKTRQN